MTEDACFPVFFVHSTTVLVLHPAMSAVALTETPLAMLFATVSKVSLEWRIPSYAVPVNSVKAWLHSLHKNRRVRPMLDLRVPLAIMFPSPQNPYFLQLSFGHETSRYFGLGPLSPISDT